MTALTPSPIDDQTTFFEEDRNWENTPSLISSPIATSPKKMSAGKKIVLLLTGLLILLLLLAGMMGAQRRQPKKQISPTEMSTAETPLPTTAPETSTERAILNLKTEIDAADPFNNELSFPPVSFNLSVSDASKQ